MLKPVFVVSLGPGDPELITLKAIKALQSADYIFTPFTQVNGEEISRSADIMLELGIDKNKIIFFEVPMSKQREAVIKVYESIGNEIVRLYKQGNRIALTAEGDAGFYSSSQYINENLLMQGVAVERIAGVPAFIACGALANLHIVKQEERLKVIPGVVSSGELSAAIKSNETVVVMKASQCEAAIKDLISKDNTYSFHYFENAGIEGKEYYTKDCRSILNREFPYFSLLIIQKQP